MIRAGADAKEAMAKFLLGFQSHYAPLPADFMMTGG